MHSDFESLIHSSLEDICLTKNETIEMFVLFSHENILLLISSLSLKYIALDKVLFSAKKFCYFFLETYVVGTH